MPGSAADVTGEDVVWVDLADPTPEEEHLVLERFLKVHRLTLDDITKPRRDADQGAHLPKVEECLRETRRALLRVIMAPQDQRAEAILWP